MVRAQDAGFCAHGSTGFDPPLQWPVPQTAATAAPGIKTPSAYFHAFDFELDFMDASSGADFGALRCRIDKCAASAPEPAEMWISQEPAKILGVRGGDTA